MISVSIHWRRAHSTVDPRTLVEVVVRRPRVVVRTPASDARRPVARDGGLVLPRDAPRTGGDVVVFHRRRGHGDAPDRPARRVRVVGAADDERAERGGGGGGVATGGARGVSGAIVSARALSVRTDERGEGRGEEEEEESLAACFNSDGKNGVNKRRTTTLQKRFKSVNRQRIFFFTRTIYSTIATRTRSRGKETRRTARPRATSPTPPRDRRRRPTPPYTKDSTRGDVNSTSFESMAKKTAKFQRQKAARFGTKSHPNAVGTNRRRPSSSGTLTSPPTSTAFASVGRHPRVLSFFPHTTDVERARTSSQRSSSRLVSMPSRSSSVARKRPARNRRCRVMCDYTTVTRSY